MNRVGKHGTQGNHEGGYMKLFLSLIILITIKVYFPELVTQIESTIILFILALGMAIVQDIREIFRK